MPSPSTLFSVYNAQGARMMTGSAVRIARQLHAECVFYANTRCTVRLLGGPRPRRVFIGTPNDVCVFLLAFTH